ncbi:unnamed protein product [Sphagnum jensenii]|uniref:Translation initiation factor IF-2 n=1 Tax=Sphagnum jensenii TaxID=128206 RepID=A0ABP1B409_9BRYO
MGRRSIDAEEDEASTFSGKKKGKGKQKGKKLPKSSFDDDFAVDDDQGVRNGWSGTGAVTALGGKAEEVSEPIEENEDEDSMFSGKKKGKGKQKGKKSQKTSFDDDFAVEDEEGDRAALSGAAGTATIGAEVFEPIVEKETPLEVDVDESNMFSGKKKGKGKQKGKKSQKTSFDEDFAVEDHEGSRNGLSSSAVGAEEEEVSKPSTGKELPGEVDEDETSIFSGKKKGKGKLKGKTVQTSLDDDFAVEDDEGVRNGLSGPTALVAVGTEGEEVSEPILEEELPAEADEDESSIFSGKKKGKGKQKGKKVARPFLDDDFAVEDNKGLRHELSGTAALVTVGTVDEGVSEPLLEKDLPVQVEEDEASMFSGKKKGKGKQKGKNLQKTSFDDDFAVEDDEGMINGWSGAAGIVAVGEETEEVPEPIIEREFSGEVDEDEASMFSGKKKGKGKQKGKKVLQMSPEDLAKKKGKKSGRTIQEEEDLDAILAELDGPPKGGAIAAPVEPEVPIQVEETSSIAVELSPATELAVPEAEEVAESAAAKKKKKKKEKEKEKVKAGTEEKTREEAAIDDKTQAVKQEEPKGKVVDKKVPKHVREMQERLARMKEAEEKRLREEEEKRLQEEEKQRRIEELERQKEEAKRKRKEREKEKILQKKKEGKLLTGKKKEEARRLALMREQYGFPAEGDATRAGDEVSSAPRKPKYETKKNRRPQSGPAVTDEVAANVLEAEAEEHEQVCWTELDNEQVAELEHEPEPEPEPEPTLDVAVEEEEEEEDWDAKSWEQEVNLPAIKSAFAEEEVDDGPVKAGQVITPHVSVASTQPKPTSPKKKAAPPVKGPRHKVVESEDEDDEDNDEEAGESEEDEAHSKRQRDAREKREARRVHALTKRSADDLRSPICCILGHVDTGKTKLLDCIRRTNVQEGEAGGITQQIGATYFPMENIRERTKELKSDAKLRVPGLLVIDTPGHESFTNLRARGSSLCDIAILVIDIMHGLEPQTIESLNLLKARQTPFVVALNKVDRMYGWKTCPNAPIRNALKVQTKDVNAEFEMRTNQIITELKEQGLNSELYYRNKEVRKFISIVPTSAISGEGIPDLLLLLVQLTQKMMEDKLMFISEVQCTVLEVKVVEGLGTTIDVVLVNGVLHEGDQIVVCGMQGPIVTSIRALLTPHPMKELRVKGSYQHHKELKAAQGIKLTAQGLEHAIAGTQLYVVGPDDDLEDVKEEAMQDMKNVMSRVDKSGEGVCVQASTLGSLEALLEFLKSPAVKIPVSGISIGPVHKRDVMRASVMLERKRKEFATILAFDVKVTPEAKQLADETGVRIFTADIIYHLFDQFTAYINSVKEEKRKDASEEAVFPCVLRIMPQCVFNKKDPIVVGVDVIEGVAKVGTPLCVPSRDGIDIGKIVSMEVNHKVVDTAKKGQSVAMKIVGTNADEMQKMFGRHFDMEDELVSRITRQSIDLLKENYRDDLSTEEWKLVVKLKKLFEIT